ncbi:MAG: hypothetical protein ACLR23_04645 [Clostridia bacterium]
MQKDGTEIPIWGHDEKDVLMSGEAQDFARYILNFDSSREEYEGGFRSVFGCEPCYG